MYLGEIVAVGRVTVGRKAGRKAVLYGLTELEGEEFIGIELLDGKLGAPGVAEDEVRVRVNRPRMEYDAVIGNNRDMTVFLGNGNHIEAIYSHFQRLMELPDLCDDWVENAAWSVLRKQKCYQDEHSTPRIAGTCDILGDSYLGIKAVKPLLVKAPDVGIHYTSSFRGKEGTDRVVRHRFRKKGGILSGFSRRVEIAGETPQGLAGNFLDWMAETCGRDLVVGAVAGMYQGGTDGGGWELALEEK